MEKSGGSRLLQMQARFQQKQLQERELKIASLYEAQQARALDRVRHSPGNGVTTSPPPQATVVPHQPGKVRQMFEERRTKAGIDKSYPLQPIHNTERTPPRRPLPNGYTKVTSNSHTKATVEKRTIKTHSTVSSHTVKKQQIQKLDNRVENMVNGSGDLNHNHEPDFNSDKHHTNGDLTSPDEVDKAHNNYLLEDETFPEALAPMPTPRSPEPKVVTKRPEKRSPAVRQSKSPVKPKASPAAVTPPRRVISENTVPENKPRGAMQRAANSVPKRTPAPSSSSKPRSATQSAVRNVGNSNNAAAGDACTVCGRRFAPDRIAKHQEICKKAHAKKRKPFDALKHRLAGTEAEPFIGKLRKGATASSTKPTKTTNSDWRQKHEEFIAAIRAAKQVQAHLNAGGKLSDLPPPPPSENPDYVQCPHCSRRFNQSAAERHIPKCANFQFNKPKPSNRKR